MSSAHRPTWTPAMGKDARINTKQYSSRDIAAHTKLKYRQPGQNNQDDVGRRDLRRELELAEQESEDKRRRMAGLLPIKRNNNDTTKGEVIGKETKLIEEGEEFASSSNTAKRRKILEEALLADKDDSDSDDDDSDADGRKKSNQNGKSKASSAPLSVTDNAKTNGGTSVDEEESEDDDSNDDDDDSDDDESETAELLKELEKIKRERAEEKERQEREAATNSSLDKEAQAATGNPLLNLKAALNQAGNTSPTNSVSTATTGTTSFSVKRRWDDDVIFKNQARDVNEKPKKAFVNDLLRTEFHRRFLKKFIA